MTSSRLSALHLYPVKSVGGPAPAAAVVEPWGLAGDRRWMLVDAEDRAVTQREHPRLALARARPLEGGGIELRAAGLAPLRVPVPAAAGSRTVTLFGRGIEAVPAAPEAGEWFGEFLGAKVRLAFMDDPARRRPIPRPEARPGETVSFADAHPLLLTTTASLAALNALIAAGGHPDEGPLPMDRFRPNVVVTGPVAWAEDGWRRIRIGEVVFRVTGPCARCVVTTTDQATARVGREPLRALAAHRRIGTGLMFGQNLVPETRGTLRVGDAFRVVE